MVRIVGGSFGLGDAEGEFDERPVHEVTLSDFEISRSEVTVAEYRAFAEATGRAMPPPPSWGWIADHPIVNVSWSDATAYVSWLSDQTGKDFALPTEAQWSFVARHGGKAMRYGWVGVTPSGNIADESVRSRFKGRIWSGYRDGYAATAPVASFAPNALGVFDMEGNVSEWCANYHYRYPNTPQTDPAGPRIGDHKVFRGAAFATDPWYSRVGQRNFMKPGFRGDYLGIRVVRSVKAEAPTQAPPSLP